MTTLADLRYSAKLKADRVNASTILDSDWDEWTNASAASLYRLLGQTYEDYNISKYPFTLNGGSGGNTLAIGPGSSVPKYNKLRHISRVVGSGVGTIATYAPVLRCESMLRFDGLSAPVLGNWYGSFVAVQYMILGNSIEIRPAASAGAQYLLYYIPAFQKLTQDTDTIDGTWMATDGIDEYISLDVAAKAMIKEESLDTANILHQQRDQVKVEVLAQFAQRDDNQPGRITDVKRARANFGGWGGFGGNP